MRFYCASRINLQRNMDVSQSRANSRGPLIAVIKIQIDVDHVDRIFLHLNDDDHLLAQQFQQKHGLSPAIIDHIYQRIRLSRESVQKDPSHRSSIPSQRSHQNTNQPFTTFTPQPKETQTNYGRRNDDDVRGTPFDRISKFNPVVEDNNSQIFNGSYYPPEHSERRTKYVESYRRELQNISALSEDEFQSKPQKGQTFQLEATAINGPVSTGFNTSEDLFSRFMAQKKKAESKEQSIASGGPSSLPWDSSYPAKMSYQGNREGLNGLNLSTQENIISQQQKLQRQIEQLQKQLSKNKSQSKQFVWNRPPQETQSQQYFQLKDQAFSDSRPKVIRRDSVRGSAQKEQRKQNSIRRESRQDSIRKQSSRGMLDVNAVSTFNNNYQGSSSQIESRLQEGSQNQYSFNQDNKPNRVKILKKQQMNSMRSPSLKKSYSKSDISRIQSDVTRRLYNEGEIKKNYLNKIKERAKQEQEEKEDPELTHHPQINRISKVLAEDRYGDKMVQDHLIELGRKAEQKKQAERALKQKKQLEGCSFVPQVSKISKKLMEDRSRASALLENSALVNVSAKSCSKKHTQSQAGFRPSLNKMSEAIMKSKGQTSFNQRIKTFVEQKNMRLSSRMKEKLVKEKIDEEGQVLFRPRINTTHAKGRSPKGSRIYDYLYEHSIGGKPQPKQDPKPIINQNSEMIVQQMQLKRIAWLFMELDSDQDGFISSKKICIETIDENVLEVIMPVLFEMEEMDISLSLSDFRKAIANLHVSLNTYQKSILYNYNHKNQPSAPA